MDGPASGYRLTRPLPPIPTTDPTHTTQRHLLRLPAQLPRLAQGDQLRVPRPALGRALLRAAVLRAQRPRHVRPSLRLRPACSQSLGSLLTAPLFSLHPYTHTTRIEGTFPAARYFAFETLDASLQPISYLRDADIRPLGNASNPFSSEPADLGRTQQGERGRTPGAPLPQWHLNPDAHHLLVCTHTHSLLPPLPDQGRAPGLPQRAGGHEPQLRAARVGCRAPPPVRHRPARGRVAAGARALGLRAPGPRQRARARVRAEKEGGSGAVR